MEKNYKTLNKKGMLFLKAQENKTGEINIETSRKRYKSRNPPQNTEEKQMENERKYRSSTHELQRFHTKWGKMEILSKKKITSQWQDQKKKKRLQIKLTFLNVQYNA